MEINIVSLYQMDIFRYISSWSTPPPSYISFVDNGVIWGGDSKNDIQI